MYILAQTAEVTFTEILKTAGIPGVIAIVLYWVLRSCYRFAFNDEPRAVDGKCKGPIARALNDHVDNMATISSGIEVMKDCVVGMSNLSNHHTQNHTEVMAYLRHLDQKFERLFDQLANNQFSEGMLAMFELDIKVAEEMGVDASEFRAVLVRLRQKKGNKK